jgi:tRNA U54 and U55 pseudouridine synthase Pus10
MKSRENSMKEYIKELEEKCQGRQESKRATVNSHSRNSTDGLEERFTEAFGGMSVEEVKRQLDFSVGKCL